MWACLCDYRCCFTSVRVVLNDFYFKPLALIAELVATNELFSHIISLLFPSLEGLCKTEQGMDTAHEPYLENNMSRNPIYTLTPLTTFPVPVPVPPVLYSMPPRPSP